MQVKITRLDLMVDIHEVNHDEQYITWWDGQFDRSIPPNKIYETESFENIEWTEKVKVKKVYVLNTLFITKNTASVIIHAVADNMDRIIELRQEHHLTHENSSIVPMELNEFEKGDWGMVKTRDLFEWK